MTGFLVLEERRSGNHTFTTYDCRADRNDLVALLARTVRALYVDTDRLRAVLTAAAGDLAPIADTTAIEEAIRRTLTAAVPQPGAHPVPHLDVARNELAEAFAYVALPAIHQTVIPAARIEHKEIPNAPARGLDLLGLEDPPLVAVLGETKASDEAASPPSVVGTGDTSLRGQFLRFLADGDRLLIELNWALKHAAPKHHSLLARAVLAHVRGTLQLIAAPVLVRPKARRGESDFGTFEDDPGQFAPARVRFSLLTLDGNLDDLAHAVYTQARS